MTIQNSRTVGSNKDGTAAADVSRERSRPDIGKLRLCVDIDNVIARTDEIMRAAISEFTLGRVQLEYTHVTSSSYYRCRDASGAAISRDHWHDMDDHLFSQDRYLLRIKPMAGAREQLQRLSEKFVIHLATARGPKARQGTIRWLRQHGFEAYDLHFLQQDEKHLTLGHFFAAVEDHLSQAEAFAATGTAISYVFAHPWNATANEGPNLKRVASWEELAKDLLTISAPIATN